jgi:hypothetical protein
LRCYRFSGARVAATGDPMSGACKAGGEIVPYTTIPNAFLDLLMADCTGSEVKVVLYIARRTFGTRKGRERGSDAIALSQICNGIVKRDGTRLDRGTGLAKEAAVEAIRRLEFAHIIKRERGNGRTADTWKIAPELPSVKAKAPEKPRQQRFENRTTSSSEIEPLTGSKIEPAAVRKSNTQNKGSKSSSKPSSSKESLGRVLENPEAAENQNQKPSSLKVDDDENPKPKTPTEKETPTPRTPLQNPEMEFRARIAERHGNTVDVEVLLGHILRDLDHGPFSAFLEEDSKTTTAPNNLKNPTGHYRKLAREVMRKRQEEQMRISVGLPAQAPILRVHVPEEPWKPPSCVCKDGLLSDGTYCACKVGNVRRQYDERFPETPVGGTTAA